MNQRLKELQKFPVFKKCQNTKLGNLNENVHNIEENTKNIKKHKSHGIDRANSKAF